MANIERGTVKQAQWQELIRRQAESGLSVRAFCRQESLREPSFYAWRRKLAQRDAKTTNSGPTFIPAQVVGDVAPAIVLELASGNRLRLPLAMPIAQVAELVAELVRQLEQRGSP